MVNIKQLEITFKSHFGDASSDIYIFHAPGRVNLIGEHTDYNGGLVFPAALTFGTTLLARARNDRRIGLLTTNFDLIGDFDIDTIEYDDKDGWMNYPKGIVQAFLESGFELNNGYDFFYHGEIPNGAGLSSSASIEVVTAFAIKTLEHIEMSLTDIALLAQKTENKFIGVNCGIMDQFAVAHGKRGQAMMLNCQTLAYEHVPFEATGYKLIISNTNKRRSLVDSSYNTRRFECEQAVVALNNIYPDIKALGELSVTQFNEAKHVIANQVVVKRAQHVIEEVERVKQSVEALKARDLTTFGRLMNESHRSLRELYEVTGDELDALVGAAQHVTGVLGSRMTGAGFGGCTVSLVHEESVKLFISEVGSAYKEVTGLKADFYVCEVGQGVEQLA